jgi:hypothetical protein
MASFVVDIRQGHIQVEGEEKFVERVYADFRELLVKQLSGIDLADPGAAEQQIQDMPKPKSARKSGKRSGPSCAARIDGLKAEGFFDTLQTAREVTEKLREKGTAYEGKHVAAALINMTSSSKLRRVKEGGGWKYQKP